MASLGAGNQKVNLSKLMRSSDQTIKKTDKELDQNNSKLINMTYMEHTSTSRYFQQEIDIPTKLIQISISLSECLNSLTFSNISYIYNPIQYAFEPYSIYNKKYCTNEKEILFVGMNPGPFGMCQTGVPFGEVTMVKEWLGIIGQVFKPTHECPKRPILGFECKRHEESGQRFWNYFKNLCGTADIFFKHSFIYNYIPLAFLDENGKNITPASMKGDAKKRLHTICDKKLLEVIGLLKPKIIINIGSYAQQRVKTLIRTNNLANIRNICMKHPSPLAGTREEWIKDVDAFLQTENLLHYFVNPHK